MAVDYTFALTRAFSSPKKFFLDIGVLFLFGLSFVVAYFAYIFAAGIGFASKSVMPVISTRFVVAYIIFMVITILIFAKPLSYFSSLALSSNAKNPSLPMWNGQNHLIKGIKQYLVLTVYNIVFGVITFGVFASMGGITIIREYSDIVTKLSVANDSTLLPSLMQPFFESHIVNIILFAVIASVVMLIWMPITFAAIFSSAKDGTFTSGFSLEKVFRAGFSKMIGHMFLAWLIFFVAYIVLWIIIALLMIIVVGFVLAPVLLAAFFYWAGVFYFTVMGQAYNDVVDVKGLK